MHEIGEGAHPHRFERLEFIEAEAARRAAWSSVFSFVLFCTSGKKRSTRGSRFTISLLKVEIVLPLFAR